MWWGEALRSSIMSFLYSLRHSVENILQCRWLTKVVGDSLSMQCAKYMLQKRCNHVTSGWMCWKCLPEAHFSLSLAEIQLLLVRKQIKIGIADLVLDNLIGHISICVSMHSYSFVTKMRARKSSGASIFSADTEGTAAHCQCKEAFTHNL